MIVQFGNVVVDILFQEEEENSTWKIHYMNFFGDAFTEFRGTEKEAEDFAKKHFDSFRIEKVKEDVKK